MTKKLRHERSKSSKRSSEHLRASRQSEWRENIAECGANGQQTNAGTPSKKHMPSTEDCRNYIEAIINAFSEEWLNDVNLDQELHQLWRRRDEHFAKVELLSLGYSLLQMQLIDPTWVDNVVTDVRKGDIGKLFELISLGFFKQSKMQIVPAPSGQAGYDATIQTIGQKHTCYLSIKRHDMSMAEKEFRQESKALRQSAREAFTRLKLSGEVKVYACNVRIEKSDWEKLKKHLLNLQTLPDTFVLSEKFAMDTSILTRWRDALASNQVSDLVSVFAQTNKNDQNNFCQKLEEAGNKFKKANLVSDDSHSRVVLLRIHPSCDVDELERYAIERLNSSDVPLELDGVILYQPSIVRRGSQSSLEHHVRIIGSSRFSFDQMPIHMEFPIGVISQKGAKKFIVTEDEVIDLAGHYKFQEGDVYLHFEPDLSGGTTTATMSNPAPGVRTHLVSPIGVISGKSFPTDEELLIL